MMYLSTARTPRRAHKKLRHGAPESPCAIGDCVAFLSHTPRKLRGVAHDANQIEKHHEEPKCDQHHRYGCRKKESIRMNERVIHADSIARGSEEQRRGLLISQG